MRPQDAIESKIKMCAWRLYFDQMNREERYRLDDYMLLLQEQYKEHYGRYYEVRESDICLACKKAKVYKH